MAEPIKASEVAAPEVDEEVQRRNVAAAAVKQRMARANALRGMGAIGPSSDDLAAKIETGLDRRNRDQMAEFRKANGR